VENLFGSIKRKFMDYEFKNNVKGMKKKAPKLAYDILKVMS